LADDFGQRIDFRLVGRVHPDVFDVAILAARHGVTPIAEVGTVVFLDRRA
jgi:hypothetical protein